MSASPGLVAQAIDGRLSRGVVHDHKCVVYMRNRVWRTLCIEGGQQCFYRVGGPRDLVFRLAIAHRWFNQDVAGDAS